MFKIKGRKYQLSELQKNVIHKATKSELKFIQSEFGLPVKEKDISAKYSASGLSLQTAYLQARLIIADTLPEFQLPPEDEVTEIPEMIISNARGQMECLEPLPLSMNVSQEKMFRVSIHNESCFAWHGKIAPVNASYHWYDGKKNWYNGKKKRLPYDGLRTHLPSCGIAPGEVLEMQILVKAPDKDGDYFLELTLVQEFFSWLETKGFKSCVVPVRVNQSGNDS